MKDKERYVIFAKKQIQYLQKNTDMCDGDSCRYCPIANNNNNANEPCFQYIKRYGISISDYKSGHLGAILLRLHGLQAWLKENNEIDKDLKEKLGQV